MTIAGFIARCEVCPQWAIVDAQPEEGWACPRCRAAGFGDCDVSQAEPVAPVVFSGAPTLLPLSDPFAVALKRECLRAPEQPLIAAVVAGETFYLSSWTEREGSPCLEVSWISETQLQLPPPLRVEPVTDQPWGPPIVHTTSAVIEDARTPGVNDAINAELRRAMDDENDDGALQ